MTDPLSAITALANTPEGLARLVEAFRANPEVAMALVPSRLQRRAWMLRKAQAVRIGRQMNKLDRAVDKRDEGRAAAAIAAIAALRENEEPIDPEDAVRRARAMINAAAMAPWRDSQ